MRVTKGIAEIVAKKMVKARREELYELKRTFKSHVAGLYMSQLDKAVFNTYKKYPDYFRSTSRIYFLGPGFNNESIVVDDSVPVHQSAWLKVDAQDAALLRSTYDQLHDEELAIDKMEGDINIALCNLRTYKNVQRDFPEAFHYLPTRETTALAINLAPLRAAIVEMDSSISQ